MNKITAKLPDYIILENPLTHLYYLYVLVLKMFHDIGRVFTLQLVPAYR